MGIFCRAARNCTSSFSPVNIQQTLKIHIFSERFFFDDIMPRDNIYLKMIILCYYETLNRHQTHKADRNSKRPHIYYRIGVYMDDTLASVDTCGKICAEKCANSLRDWHPSVWIQCNFSEWLCFRVYMYVTYTVCFWIFLNCIELLIHRGCCYSPINNPIHSDPFKNILFVETKSYSCTQPQTWIRMME